MANEDFSTMGNAIEALSVSIIEGDDSGYLNMAVMLLSQKISWTTDRCLGFQKKNSDQWLISETWEENNRDKQTSKE